MRNPEDFADAGPPVLAMGAGIWQAADAALTRPGNATAYADKKAVGSSSSCLFTFSDFFRRKGASALLLGAKLEIYKSGGISVPSGFAVRAWLYAGAPSSPPASDQADFLLNHANAAVRLGYLDFSTAVSGASGSDCYEAYAEPTLPRTLKAPADVDDLCMVIHSTGAWTPTSGSVWMPYVQALE